MACGEEMRVVRVVPDDTMPVPGYEHHTLECPACHEVECRLAFIRELEPVLVELEPSPIEPEPVEPKSFESQQDVPVASQNPQAAARTWVRAIDRLRNQQSFLQERQAEKRAAEAVRQFHSDWEDLVRTRRQSTARAAGPATVVPPRAKVAKAPDPAQERSVPEAAPRPNAPRSSAMARVIARLHGRELWRRAAARTDESQRFDQMWDSFAPPPPSTPTRKPRAIAARSRSLVPVDAPVGEAWSTWARAMMLLRATR